MLDADTLSRVAIAAQAATDKKAFDLVGLEVGELTSYADCFLLCSATSERQVGAVVDEVARRLKADGAPLLHTEGDVRRSDWVLLDYGDFVVHVFTEDRRAYYALDSLWGDAPRIDHASLGIDRPQASDER
jgi:ribosome-associated protein